MAKQPYEIPKTKAEFDLLPYKYRQELKQSLANDNGYLIQNPNDGSWGDDVETAIGAYHGFTQPASDKIMNDVRTNEVNYPGINKAMTNARQNPVQTKQTEPDYTKNPVLSYIQSMKPTYDVDKEKRLKTAALINALGGILSSAANVYGASKGGVAVPTPEAGSLNYVAGSLKEMKDTQNKLGEGYKMLNLQELIRQENQKDQERNMDKRWGENAKQIEQQYKYELDMLDKKIAQATAAEKRDLENKKALITEEFNNSMKLLEAQGQNQLDIIGRQESKEVKVEEVKQGNRIKTIQARADAIKEDKGIYLINPSTDKPYPRPIYENEIPALYAKLKKYVPAEVQALEIELANTYDKKTIMGTVVAELSRYIKEDIDNLFATPMQKPAMSEQEAQSTGGIY